MLFQWIGQLLIFLIALGSLRNTGRHACNTADIVYIRDQPMALMYPTHLGRERPTIPEELNRRRRGCRAKLKQRMKKRRYKPCIAAFNIGNVRSFANKVDELEARSTLLRAAKRKHCLDQGTEQNSNEYKGSLSAASGRARTQFKRKLEHKLENNSIRDVWSG